MKNLNNSTLFLLLFKFAGISASSQRISNSLSLQTLSHLKVRLIIVKKQTTIIQKKGIKPGTKWMTEGEDSSNLGPIT